MDYLPVFILLLAGAGIGAAAIVASYLIGPKRPHRMKDQPFECGVPPLGTTQQRISVRFFLVAILFLIFDVEGVFFYPWALVFRKFMPYGLFIIVEMAIFVGVLLIGYYYVLRKRALEWD
jgi:NADH-quinone oxidoreductase subunit A